MNTSGGIMIDLQSTQEASDRLSKEQFHVLMIWAEGCHVCQVAKPDFEKLETEFSTFNFMKWQLNDESHKFYSNFEEKQPVKVDVLDEDGDPIVDADGKKMQKLLKDDNGEVVLEVPISIPKYYVFHGSERGDDNPYGLLGKVDGHNLEQLKHILTQIKLMEEQENE